ncbi:MAG: hypothetical protein E6J45_06845 [Chloroflexi bacterium]|nr:MAG: hypothetical protein E6J45_06845 [Chloroflexota bacterium]
MQRTESPPDHSLAAGDPRRARAGRAVLDTLLVAAIFAPYALGAKEVPAIYQHVPWRDDPYDAVVSFTVFFVPMLAGLILLRIPLCRNDTPLPVSRVVGLVRACRVTLLAVLLTVGGEWVAVALRAGGSSWDWRTGVAIALLTVVTAAAAVAYFRVQRAVKQLPRWRVHDALDPDWIADAVVVAEQLAGWLGPFRTAAVRVLRWLDAHIVDETRRHPITAAATLALLFGLALAASAAREHGPAPVLLLFVGVAASGMFAFIVSTGTYVGLVRSVQPSRGVRRRVIDALVVSAASVPVTLAFRDWLGWIAGAETGGVGAARLGRLLIIVAAAVFVIVLAAESAGRAYTPRTTL